VGQVASGPSGFVDRLTPADRAALLTTGYPRRYRTGAVLFTEGARGGFAVLITSGQAKIVATTVEGNQAVLSLRGPGDLIGELAVIDDDAAPRSATAVALEPLACRVLPSADLRSFLEGHPLATVELLKMLAARLREADRRRVEFGAFDTTRRLAGLLVDIAGVRGRPLDDGLHVEAGLSQADLAGLIGASRESVARALTVLRRRGYVTTGRRRLVVRDLSGLRTYAR
jgi:CRP/FNR family transcriptional regulator, cyclic AMP receptor protein